MSTIRKTEQPVCEACGQPIVIPSELPLLTPIQQRIFDLVKRRPGITAEGLRNFVWQNDPNGGPECRHTIFVPSIKSRLCHERGP